MRITVSRSDRTHHVCLEEVTGSFKPEILPQSSIESNKYKARGNYNRFRNQNIVKLIARPEKNTNNENNIVRKNKAFKT